MTRSRSKGKYLDCSQNSSLLSRNKSVCSTSLNLTNMILSTNYEKHEKAREEKKNLRSHLVYSDKIVKFLTKEVETQLLRIFQYYSSIGEPMNIFFMKTSKFHKMLRHLGLLCRNEERQDFASNTSYVHKSFHLTSNPYTNKGASMDDIDLTEDSEENLEGQNHLMNTYDGNSLNRSSLEQNEEGKHRLNTEGGVNKDSICPEFKSRIHLSEYTKESPFSNLKQEKSKPCQISEIEVDLLLKYLITPSVPEDPNQRNPLEVVSTSQHKRQFLVNQEEHKQDYKFGLSQKRSSFLPQEVQGEEEFYINLQEQKTKSYNGKLDYNTFVKALELCARKIYPNLDNGDAFVNLVKFEVIPLYREVILSEHAEEELGYEQKIAQAYEILDNQNVIDLLSVVYKQFIPFFKNFCGPQRTKIDLETYLDAMLDFALYPSLISRSQCVKLFKYLVEIMRRSEGEFDPCRLVFRDFDDPSITLEEPEVMDSHMFIESLAMIGIIHVQSLGTRNKKRVYVTRILSLCDRIAHSMKGYSFSFREDSADPDEILGQFKERYPWFWKS